MKLCTTAGIAACLIEGIRLLPVLAILVILLTLLRVANYLISLIQCLKLGFRLRVIGMKIGMELLGSLKKSPAHIFLWNVAVYT